MIKPAIPTATITIMNMENPPKTEIAGPPEPLAIRVAEAAIAEKIIATTLTMATIGIMTLIKLA
jgi:hypothetical protein